jgi:hypothetical protein
MEGLVGNKAKVLESGDLFISANYDYIARGVACVVIAAICAAHTFMPVTAIKIQDSFVIFKASLMIFGIGTGIVAVCGGFSGLELTEALADPFEGTEFSMHNFGAAFFQILFGMLVLIY